MNKTIVITTEPIDRPADKMFECAVDDHDLSNAICKYADALRRSDIEVFKRVKNIIATDKGYYFAWYEEDVHNMEGGLNNPIPFKGKDGRMKVTIKAEDGRYSSEDLATLVAMAFCPNLSKHKKTWFKDGDTGNCNADNIYWLPVWEYRIIKTLYNIGIKIKRK